MTDRTEAVTTSLLRLALDAASMNHQAIANNIANINSPGYRPAQVNFESQLQAVRDAANTGRPVESSMLAGIRPYIERADVAPAGDRTATLDMEAAKLAENTVHYEALLKVMGMRLSTLGAAINEGKR
jgi:flagellar basal-body rod protein FlgB